MQIGEKTKHVLKQTGHYGTFVLVLLIGFFIGYKFHKLAPTPTKQNPYSKVYTPNDISIAVNESNDLLLIYKKTGEYMIYSDSIGNCIFKMYANKIYQEHKPEAVK